MKFLMHNSMRHTASECREIKKLAEQFREKMQQQQRQDGMPSCQREGKQKVDMEKGEELEFQDAKRALEAVYGNSDSDSSDNEHCKALHVMFEGSWDITSWRTVKTLHREIAATAPMPRAAPHHKWMETPIEFDASDCTKNMVGAEQLPLLVSSTIANIKLYHVLIDGGPHSTSPVSQLSRRCRFRWGISSHHAHSQEWARCQLCHAVVSPSQSHTGQLRTSTWRASSSTS
jgi:hypothetical protein